MRRWGAFTAAGFALALSGTGCVTCTPPESHALVRNAGPTCEVPHCARDRVYAFLIGGLNPLCGDGIGELQDCLFRHGFCKVGRAGCLHGSWVLGEMARIRACDDNAHFILIGNDVGALTAMKTAARAHEQGIPVDAVIVMDPIGPPWMKSLPDVRTVLLRSGGGTVVIANAEIVPVPDATPFNLAGQHATMATVVSVMEEVATAVWAELPDEERFLTVTQDLLPGGSRSVPTGDTAKGEWSFLDERVGTVTAPLPEAVVEYPSSR